MRKIGRDPSTIPELDAEQDDDELAEGADEEQEDTERGEDDKYRFPRGHIMKWWSHLSQLPSEIQPVLCPTAGFSDTFKLLSEVAVIALLWGTANTPTRRIMDTVCLKKDAQAMADNTYGELFHLLFIGDKVEIAGNYGKVQTTYGKRTTTMARTSTRASHTVSKLKTHVNNWFAYLAERRSE